MVIIITTDCISNILNTRYFYMFQVKRFVMKEFLDVLTDHLKFDCSNGQEFAAYKYHIWL